MGLQPSSNQVNNILIITIPVCTLLILLSILIAFAVRYKDIVKKCFSKISRYVCPYRFSKLPSKPGGLKNNSTACYMNSMIQAIASSDVIIQQFEDMKLLKYESKPLNILLELLHGINKEEKSNENLLTNTKLLESLLDQVYWTKPSQQDTFELLSAFVKGIHDDFKKHLTEPIQMAMKIKLVHTFTGMNMPNKVQDHLGLSVGLCGNYRSRPGVTLDYLIQEHFSATPIDDDESKKTQMFFYREVPDILLLHIQANKWDAEKGEMMKPEYHVIYDRNLSLNLEIMPELHSPIRRVEVHYKIKAVIQHIGSIQGGHYVTYRNWRDKWYMANDEYVRDVTFDKSITPYILIYERQQETEYTP